MRQEHNEIEWCIINELNFKCRQWNINPLLIDRLFLLLLVTYNQFNEKRGARISFLSAGSSSSPPRSLGQTLVFMNCNCLLLPRYTLLAVSAQMVDEWGELPLLFIFSYPKLGHMWWFIVSITHNITSDKCATVWTGTHWPEADCSLSLSLSHCYFDAIALSHRGWIHLFIQRKNLMSHSCHDWAKLYRRRDSEMLCHSTWVSLGYFFLPSFLQIVYAEGNRFLLLQSFHVLSLSLSLTFAVSLLTSSIIKLQHWLTAWWLTEQLIGLTNDLKWVVDQSVTPVIALSFWATGLAAVGSNFFDPVTWHVKSLPNLARILT